MRRGKCPAHPMWCIRWKGLPPLRLASWIARRGSDSVRKHMSSEADAPVWGPLFFACRVHKNVEMGERVASELLRISRPRTSAQPPNGRVMMNTQYVNAPYPYNMDGSFMEYFEGLTYDHVNFIFSGPAQDSYYPSVNSNYYKLSEYGTYSYCDYGHVYEMNGHLQGYHENRRQLASPSMMTSEQVVAANCNWDTDMTHDIPTACPRRHPNSQDYQVVWQDAVDPDNMTYEELLELGEAVGTQSRGLSPDVISFLPVSKYKRGFFSRKKSRDDRCVICQMEYKRGDWRMTLPCKHIYHANCCSKWLGINKACPICYTEVSMDASRIVKK
ncbi:hypothetical protein MLD38_004204 [Melastoma candidum]|uniref:Uncharacterized protein n=1 Tax=Melastoma candidum TaxID=119954 RepID=A0ACB9S6H6_9MYRT|nr:hypothetical protein MLD38_004204 [Melastoma candidum]